MDISQTSMPDTAYGRLMNTNCFFIFALKKMKVAISADHSILPASAAWWKLRVPGRSAYYQHSMAA